jgi:histidine triad (HIT) family protein
MSDDLDINCIFCGIVNKSIKANIVYETDNIVAFHDINKVADVHVLIIPKQHFSSLSDVPEESGEIMGDLLLAGKAIAAQLHVKKSGYRLVINSGRDAGQTVFHLHMHLLGNRVFSWPPG